MERLKERLEAAKKALMHLKESAGVENPPLEKRDAAIKRFEYSWEALWKAAQRYLLVCGGIEDNSPKGVIRRCREAGFLSDEQAILAIEMVDARNLTSHTYDQDLASRVYDRLEAYASLMDVWLQQLELAVGDSGKKKE
jgi:nucleotidyltransferase substrate binding protein (TIGR01987 family)